MTAFDWPKVGWYRISTMISYKDIACCPETNSAYVRTGMQCFIDPFPVYTHIKIMIVKRFLHFLKSDTKQEVVEVIRIVDGLHMTTMIEFILETVMLRLLQPTSKF